jgi:hypothetical protein
MCKHVPHRPGLRIAAALIVLIAAAMGRGGAARAAGPEPTTLAVTTDDPQVEGQGYVVNARLTTAAGKPVNSVTLSFYVLADLFGPHQMLIGTATTDGQGRVSLKYSPAWEGQHDVTMKFAGSVAYAPAEGKGAFLSTVALAPHQNELLPLSGFSEKVPYAVGVLVLGVCAGHRLRAGQQSTRGHERRPPGDGGRGHPAAGRQRRVVAAA